MATYYAEILEEIDSAISRGAKTFSELDPELQGKLAIRTEMTPESETVLIREVIIYCLTNDELMNYLAKRFQNIPAGKYGNVRRKLTDILLEDL